MTDRTTQELIEAVNQRFERATVIPLLARYHEQASAMGYRDRRKHLKMACSIACHAFENLDDLTPEDLTVLEDLLNDTVPMCTYQEDFRRTATLIRARLDQLKPRGGTVSQVATPVLLRFRSDRLADRLFVRACGGRSVESR